MTIQRSAVGRLSKLGSGGSGDVHEIVGTGMVFKEFNAKSRLTDVVSWARGSVDFWQGLSPGEQAELARMAVWPTDVVEASGVVVGVVMPLIPDDFRYDRTATDGSVERLSSDFTWLMLPRARLAGRFDADVLFDAAVRTSLVGQMLHLVAWLNARGVVFGDISMNNFVFALNPPRVLALDTDAVATGPGTASAAGRMTNFYVPPEFQGPQPQQTVDQQSDVWKAATLALRCMTPGKGATQRRPDSVGLLVGQVPDRVIDLLSLALGTDRDRRPPIDELAHCCMQHAAALSSPPVATMLDVVDPVVRRGESVVLRWDFGAVDSITVETPTGVTHVVDPARHSRGFSFDPGGSGLVAVHASNRHGTSTYALGPVLTYDVPKIEVTFTGPPPSVSPLKLPRPSFGWDVSTPVHAAPRIAIPSTPVLGASVSSARARGRVAVLLASGKDVAERISRLPR